MSEEVIIRRRRRLIKQCSSYLMMMALIIGLIRSQSTRAFISRPDTNELRRIQQQQAGFSNGRRNMVNIPFAARNPSSRLHQSTRGVGPLYFNPKGESEGKSASNTGDSSTRPGKGGVVASPPALVSSSPQYEKLMDKLSEDEKYNILLQSRSSSIIETLRKRKEASGQEDFKPLYKLVEEMTGKRVKLTSKSFAALIDAASLSRDLGVMQKCLVLSRKNGICRAFSRDVATVSAPPRDKAAVKGLEPVPQDHRIAELGAGLSALIVVGGALGDETLGPLFHMDTTPGTIVLLLAGLSGLFDFTQRKGEAIKLVFAGLNRLFLKDPEREARVQAATFLVAYLLGLPCFCYNPNVLEAVRMSEVAELKDLLKSTAGLNRLLIYLLAPVAAEESNHLQLIISDPRQARALVQIFRERNQDIDVDAEAMLIWAFEEARRLLTANSGLLDKLRKRMESGGATVGDCVCALETQVQGAGE